MREKHTTVKKKDDVAHRINGNSFPLIILVCTMVRSGIKLTT